MFLMKDLKIIKLHWVNLLNIWQTERMDGDVPFLMRKETIKTSGTDINIKQCVLLAMTNDNINFIAEQKLRTTQNYRMICL